MHASIRRSRSEPHLRCSRRGGAAGASLTTSRSIGVFPFQFGAAPIRPPPLPEGGGGDGYRLLTVCAGETDPDPDPDPEMPQVRRPDDHWLDRLLELRSRFHDPTKRFFADDDTLFEDDDDYHDHNADGGCTVGYDDEDDAAAEQDGRWDRESFTKLLARAPPADARLFAQLAFLCNMAYVIPEIKVSQHYLLRDQIPIAVRSGFDGLDLAIWPPELAQLIKTPPTVLIPTRVAARTAWGLPRRAHRSIRVLNFRRILCG
jgi:hypothetical protein